MYKVKLIGNFNVCVGDLNATFTQTRSEKIFSDSEFENSEDIKKYIGKYLSAEYVEVKQLNRQTIKTYTKPSIPAEVKTETTTVNDKDRIIVQAKSNLDDSDIVNADNASLSKETTPLNDSDIIKADGASFEKNIITEEDKKSVRIDNFGNTVQDVQDSIPYVEEVKHDVVTTDSVVEPTNDIKQSNITDNVPLQESPQNEEQVIVETSNIDTDINQTSLDTTPERTSKKQRGKKSTKSTNKNNGVETI